MNEGKIITFLEGLTPADFAKVVVRIKGAGEQIPMEATHPQKVTALVGYMRSTTGQGMDFLCDVLTITFPQYDFVNDGPLTPTKRQQLREMLAPIFPASSSGRRALIFKALGEGTVSGKVDCSGDTDVFVAQLIRVLDAEGEIESGTTALWALCKGLRDHIDSNEQTALDALETVVNRGVKNALPTNEDRPLSGDFFITREIDQKFADAIQRREAVILVRGARQMGKTTVVERGLKEASKAGNRCIHTYFHRFNKNDFVSPEKFYSGLAVLIATQLELPEPEWDTDLPPTEQLETYLVEQVLGSAESPTLWVLDGIDVLLSMNLGSEFFGLLRSWFNARALDQRGNWNRLMMVITYATETRQLIDRYDQSPFNVGVPLTLDDFTRQEVVEINQLYQNPLKNNSEIDRFHRLLGGHPFLTSQGLAYLYTESRSLRDLERIADKNDGPFGEHLQQVFTVVTSSEETKETMCRVLRGEYVLDSGKFYRLWSSGLVKRGQNAGQIRCELYKQYLKPLVACPE